MRDFPGSDRWTPDRDGGGGWLRAARDWWKYEKPYFALAALGLVLVLTVRMAPQGRMLLGRFAALSSYPKAGAARIETRERMISEALEGRPGAAAPSHPVVFAAAAFLASLTVPVFAGGLVGSAVLAVCAIASGSARKRIGVRIPGAAPDSPFGLWDFTWSFMTLAMFSVCAQMLIAAWSLYPGEWDVPSDDRCVALPILGQILAQAAVAALLLAKARRLAWADAEELGFGGDPRYGMAVGAGVFILSFWAMQAAGRLGESLWGAFGGTEPGPHPVVPMLMEDRHPATAVLVFSATVLAAPALEEIFFRGVIYGAMSRWVPRLLAAVLQAALFASAHRNESQFLPIFVMGILLAWLYERTGSLWAPITFHSLNNLAAMSRVMMLWAFGPGPAG
ncbi:MAG: CPBP family intramembrane metalloprotease [Planctomycetota bacterium]|nr:CPBP family intramembrane metalloprotease [Planctomycetota bacterium]